MTKIAKIYPVSWGSFVQKTSIADIQNPHQAQKPGKLWPKCMLNSLRLFNICEKFSNLVSI